MTKVWIVEGEHHAVPGMVVKVCASKPLADLEAAALVKIILHDLAGGTDVTADNWEEQLEAAKVEYIDHYNDEPRVEISEHDVIGDREAMPEYRIKVARTSIEEFIVHAKDHVHLQEKWPDAIGVADPVESYSDGDELIQFTDEETGHTVVVKS